MADDAGAPENVLDFRAVRSGAAIMEALMKCTDVPEVIDLRGLSLEAKTLSALEDFIDESYEEPGSLHLLDLRGARGKGANDVAQLHLLLRGVAARAPVRAVGAGPSLLDMASLRAGETPELDLRADIVELSEATLGTAEAGGAQVLENEDAASLAAALLPFTFSVGTPKDGRVGIPLLLCVRLREAWLPLWSLGSERTLRYAPASAKVGLVRRLRQSVRAPSDDAVAGDEEDPEEKRLRVSVTGLLGLLDGWLDKTKLRLLDVFRSQHLNRVDKGADAKDAANDEDSLDEDEVIGLFRYTGLFLTNPDPDALPLAVNDLVTFLDKDGARGYDGGQISRLVTCAACSSLSLSEHR